MPRFDTLSTSSLPVSGRLRVAVNPSRLQRCYLLAAHLLATWGVLSAGFYAFVPCLLASACYYAVNRSRQPVLLTLEGTRCEVRLCNGRHIAGELAGGHFVTPLLVVVRLKTAPWRYRYVPLFCDAVPGQMFRRLRIALRFAPLSKSGSLRAPE